MLICLDSLGSFDSLLPDTVDIVRQSFTMFHSPSEKKYESDKVGLVVPTFPAA